MREQKLMNVISLSLLTLVLAVGCGKKKNNNGDAPPPPPPPQAGPPAPPPPNGNYHPNPNYPTYDINGQPVLIRIHNFASGETRIECLNFQNQEVPCGNILRMAGVQPNPYLPFQEIPVDGFGYGQQYQNHYSGWNNYPYQSYPSYPGGTIYPYQNGFRFNANIQGYY